MAKPFIKAASVMPGQWKQSLFNKYRLIQTNHDLNTYHWSTMEGVCRKFIVLKKKKLITKQYA